MRLFYGIDFDLISLNKLFFMKSIVNIILISIVLTGFTNCSSAQKLEKQVSFKIGEVYYQHWVAGIKGGGSGVNIFIPIDNLDNNVKLDSVYFKGKATKLEVKPNTPTLFIGRFLTLANSHADIVMSDKPEEEYGNQLPEQTKKSPFELEENECVISYIQDGKSRYFKIENIIEKKAEFYPSAPPRKQ